MHLNIRLDKLTEPRGSPTLDDIAAFARALTPALEAALGEEFASTLQYEISSPGALRALSIPSELHRFRSSLLSVEYDMETEEGAAEDGVARPGRANRVLWFLAEDGSVSTWRLADVPANWKALGKKTGQRLSRREAEREVTIPLRALRTVQFYLDIHGLLGERRR